MAIHLHSESITIFIVWFLALLLMALIVIGVLNARGGEAILTYFPNTMKHNFFNVMQTPPSHQWQYFPALLIIELQMEVS